MTCNKCNQEFTQSDKEEVNYVSGMGTYSHKMCPGATCEICNEAIDSYAEAKRTPMMGWQHKTCKPVALKASKARREVLQEEIQEERGWIVK